MSKRKTSSLPPHNDSLTDTSGGTAVADAPASSTARPSILPGSAPMDDELQSSVDPDQQSMFPGHDVMLIDIADIERSNNHRHLTSVDTEKIRELADSIKACGLLQPIRVYQRPADEVKANQPRYVIGYGYRRTAAHELLGRTQILAQVCPPAAAWEIQQARATENLARQDLDALEELTAVTQMVTACKGDVPKAAGLIGRSIKWINDRLYLDRLDPKIKQLILEKKINLAHARELAKLYDRNAQVELVEWCQTWVRMQEGVPDSWFRTQIANRMRQLKDAPWDLSLPIAGKPACDSCAHNSANDLELFELEPGKQASPTCASAVCYTIKQKAADKLMVKAVKSVAGDVEANGGKLSIKVAREKAPEGLRPEALMKEVKREASPALEAARKKKETLEQKRERLGKQKFDKAVREHEEARRAEICAAINKTPQRRLIFELMRQCPTFDQGQLYKWNNPKGKLKKDAKQLFETLMRLDDAAVMAMAKDLQTETDFFVGLTDLPAPLCDQAFKALEIPPAAPMPKLEDFLPPIESPKTKPAKGKKTSRKGKGAKASVAAVDKPSGGEGKPSRKGKAAAAGDYLDDDAEGGDA